MRKLKLDELNRISVSEHKAKEKLQIIVILDNIRSGNNVGAFFRTSDAFNIKCIYLSGITATPPHKEITKSAIGATESVDWEYFKTTSDACIKAKSEGYALIGIEQTDESIPLQAMEMDGNSKIAVIFGNEVMGLSDDVLPLLDRSVEVPQFGTKHSLNVSVCGGVVLWHLMASHLHYIKKI